MDCTWYGTRFGAGEKSSLVSSHQPNHNCQLLTDNRQLISIPAVPE
ncbi:MULTISPECIES: hypothetical protein [unclassified Microcoleus]|nr:MULTISPECIES: hypothetical protein [unclassified Microcoleus]